MTLEYEFICLCCGARNGAEIPQCSYRRFVSNPDIDSEEHSRQLTDWICSSDYKGAVLVPVNFQMDEDYRLRIVRATSLVRESRDGGLLLFKLPGMSPRLLAIDLALFLN